MFKVFQSPVRIKWMGHRSRPIRKLYVSFTYLKVPVSIYVSFPLSFHWVTQNPWYTHVAIEYIRRCFWVALCVVTGEKWSPLRLWRGGSLHGLSTPNSRHLDHVFGSRGTEVSGRGRGSRHRRTSRFRFCVPVGPPPNSNIYPLTLSAFSSEPPWSYRVPNGTSDS